MIKLWLGFSLLYLAIGIFNYWRYTRMKETFRYYVLLCRESTQSILRVELTLPQGREENEFIDSTMRKEYPGWTIGCMTIQPVLMP
jgi:hypothetical protein